MHKITISGSNRRTEFIVSFLDNATARAIVKKLPFKSRIRTWGNEIFFDTGIRAPASGATVDIAVGDIAYWPDGKAMCIYFGPTPMSTDDKPVPASEVILIGKAEISSDELRKVHSGSVVNVE